MLQVPLKPIANQTAVIALGGQNCRINIYQRDTGLFCTLYADDRLIISGVICENLNRLVRDAYLGFIGDLGFYDTQGVDDPYYTGLGVRYLLVYIEASELGGAG